MKTKKADTVKVVTDEVVMTTVKDGLINELGNKRNLLKDKEARLNGGQFLNQNYLPIDKEIDRLGRILKMKEIEIQKDAPSSVKYAYEEDVEWMTLRRGFAQEELDDGKKRLIFLMEHKEKLIKEVEELKARIKVLEKELNVEE